MTTRALLILLLIGLLVGCDAVETPTMTPTRAFSGPTLEPSPTLHIRTSDEIYNATTPVGQVGQNSLTAAVMPNEGGMPPIISGTREPNSGAEVVQVVAEDGTMMNGDLYQREGSGRIPGVLLIAPDRTAWGVLPLQLQNRNITVLVMDARPNGTASDVDAMLLALSELGTVDPARIGVIGAGPGADMALLGCVVNSICDAVVLLSPLARDTLLNALVDYNPRALMLVAAQQDATSYPAALALAQAATGPTEFLEYEAGQGAALLANLGLSDAIINWLATQFGG